MSLYFIVSHQLLGISCKLYFRQLLASAVTCNKSTVKSTLKVCMSCEHLSISVNIGTIDLTAREGFFLRAFSIQSHSN